MSKGNGKALLSRRDFVVGTAIVVGNAIMSKFDSLWQAPRVQAQTVTLTPQAYLPHIASNRDQAADSRVVHIHTNSATNWNGETAYWLHVDQTIVNEMVNRGVMELTGTSTVSDAWRTLIPSYQTGQKIAIKVNFNNSKDCAGTETRIDAIIEPVNAVVNGLEQIGVPRANICVYDATRPFPDRFVNRGLTGVSYYDNGSCCTPAGFSDLPGNQIEFHPPAGVTMPEQKVCDVVMNATYLINIPIMKSHTIAGVSLSAKNHFGTIKRCGQLHDYINVAEKPPSYRADYNPLVDLIGSPLLGGKTVLTIGDGLFAGKQYNQPPTLWATFGNKLPNSLFFSSDLVAIDCVMHDFVVAELGTYIPSDANNYLLLAADAGLGTFESTNPWTGSYNLIDYQKIEL